MILLCNHFLLLRSWHILIPIHLHTLVQMQVGESPYSLHYRDCIHQFPILVASLPHHLTDFSGPSPPYSCEPVLINRGCKIQYTPKHVSRFILQNGCHLQLNPMLYETLSPPNVIIPTVCPISSLQCWPHPLLLFPPNNLMKVHTDTGMEIVRLALHCLFFCK